MKTQSKRHNSLEDQGYTNSILNNLYNQLEVEKDYYEFKSIVDHYFKGRILLLKGRYVGETLGEDDIMEVLFEYLKKDIPVKIARYIRDHVVEASRIKVPLNSWMVKAIKCHTRSNRHLYRVKDIYRVYKL